MKPELTPWEAQLDEAKRAYRELGPSEDQLARMLRAVEAGPSGDLSAAGPSLGKPLALKLVKLTVVALGVVATGLGITWRVPSLPPPLPVIPRVETSVPPAPPTPVHHRLAGGSTTSEAPAVTARPAEPKEPAKGSRRRRTSDEGSGSLVDELALLQRARRILLKDPARALTLADEHARDYPRGVFAEERELLAVQALLATDQRAVAERRARRFARVHPSSVHAHRMRVLLKRPED